MRWIVGTGRVNSGGLRDQACCCTCLTARFAQTVKPFLMLILSTCTILFKCILLFQNSTLLCRQKQNLCRHVIFSQNCCCVANFVDKMLVDDSTNTQTHKVQQYTCIMHVINNLLEIYLVTNLKFIWVNKCPFFGKNENNCTNTNFKQSCYLFFTHIVTHVHTHTHHHHMPTITHTHEFWWTHSSHTDRSQVYRQSCTRPHAHVKHTHTSQTHTHTHTHTS